ncbi:hypothetical protein BGW37DRAFT_498690 [Umbelopsis sp. PMI_123]|nr:hypothetical protein BGW37DRAFT_498690 [Umbelopsis sp. PMI_123]
MDASASKRLLACINGAHSCPQSLTIPAKQDDFTDCTEALVCHVLYDPKGLAFSVEVVRVAVFFYRHFPMFTHIIRCSLTSNISQNNYAILSAQALDALTVCTYPELFDRLFEMLLSLEIENEYPCRNGVVNTLCEAAKIFDASIRKRWAISFIRKHCQFLFAPTISNPEEILLRQNLFSLCYDIYADSARSDVKLLRLLESTLHELHISVTDWQSKAATDKSYIIRKCINDCEEILNLVVDRPSHFALHAQRFQELIPHNWIAHMPSILLMICLYSKFYPENMYPFLGYLKRNRIMIEPSDSVLSKQMIALLSVSDTSMIMIECACLEVESAIIGKNNEVNINTNGFIMTNELEKLEFFEDDVTEVQHIDAFIQELCLIVATAPPSQMTKVAWVVIAAFDRVGSRCYSGQMGDVGRYSSSIVMAMMSKVSDLLKDLVFTLSCKYEIGDALLRPLIATVSAFSIALRSPPFEAHSNEDTFLRLEIDIEKVWKNHRIRRRAYLVTHSQHDLQNEDTCSWSIYNVLQVIKKSVG